MNLNLKNTLLFWMIFMGRAYAHGTFPPPASGLAAVNAPHVAGGRHKSWPDTAAAHAAKKKDAALKMNINNDAMTPMKTDAENNPADTGQL